MPPPPLTSLLPPADSVDNETPDGKNLSPNLESNSLEESEQYNLFRDPQPASKSTSKKRARKHLSEGGDKTNSSFQSIHALQTILSLSKAILKMNEALQEDCHMFDRGKICELMGDCMGIVIHTLSEKISQLSVSCNTTSGKKNASLAHRKVMKRDQLKLKNDLLLKNVMATNPVDKLNLAFKNTRESLTHLNCKSIQDGDLPVSKAPKLISETSVILPSGQDIRVIQLYPPGNFLAPGASLPVGGEIARATVVPRRSKNADREFVVGGRTLENPSDGNKMYTPLQMCVILQREESHASTLSGVEKRGQLRTVKDVIVDDDLVPVKMTQLNYIYLCWKRNGSCKQYWGDKTSNEIMPIDDLVVKFTEQQLRRTAQLWRKEDTKKALFEEKLAASTKKGLAPETAKEPNYQTVNAYHSALMSREEVVLRKGKDKEVH